MHKVPGGRYLRRHTLASVLRRPARARTCRVSGVRTKRSSQWARHPTSPTYPLGLSRHKYFKGRKVTITNATNTMPARKKSVDIYNFNAIMEMHACSNHNQTLALTQSCRLTLLTPITHNPKSLNNGGLEPPQGPSTGGTLPCPVVTNSGAHRSRGSDLPQAKTKCEYRSNPQLEDSQPLVTMPISRQVSTYLFLPLSRPYLRPCHYGSNYFQRSSLNAILVSMSMTPLFSNVQVHSYIHTSRGSNHTCPFRFNHSLCSTTLEA